MSGRIALCKMLPTLALAGCTPTLRTIELPKDYRANIMTEIAKCWDTDMATRQYPNIIGVLVHMNKDATVKDMHLTPGEIQRAAQDSAFKQQADAAMQAIRQCSPMTFLPPDKYKEWSYMELRFDPEPVLVK